MITIELLDYKPKKMKLLKMDNTLIVAARYNEYHPGSLGTEFEGYDVTSTWVGGAGLLALLIYKKIIAEGKRAELSFRDIGETEYQLLMGQE